MDKERRNRIRQDVDKVMEEMLTICNIPSPTGYTHILEEYLMKRLQVLGFTPWQRHKGGVLCELALGAEPKSSQEGDEALLLSAHIDTLGLMVQSIKKNGRLALTTLGGFPFNYVEQENVQVFTRTGKTFEGTVRITNPAVHASRKVGKKKRDTKNIELVLDEEVKSKEDVQKLGISIGDFVALDPRAKLAGDGFLKSRHLDDKASTAMLLYLAEEVAAKRLVLERKTYLFFTNYEEIGHGAAGGFPLGVSDMLAVDMGVVGKGLDTDEYVVSICAKDSSGPYNYFFTNELIALAKKHKLDYAIDVYPFYFSDCKAALTAGHDIRHALIGTGVAASHGYERIHRKGVANTIALLEAYVSGK